MLESYKYFLLLFILVNVFPNYILAQNTNSINRIGEELPFTVYKTLDNTITINDVLLKNIEFKTVENQKTHPLDIYWIKIDLKSELDSLKTEDIWYLRTRTYEYGAVFFKENGAIVQKKIGRFDNISNNPSVLYNQGIPFKTESLIEGKYLYLKIKRVVFFDNVKNWKFTYKSQEKEDLTQYFYSHNNIKILIPVYIFVGICLIMFILTLAFFFYSKRMEFLFYTFYVSALFLYLTADILKLHELFFGEYNLISYTFFQVSQVVINLFYILFIISYLNTKTEYPNLHKALKFIAYILTIIIVLDTTFLLSKYFIGHIYLLDFERIVMSLFGLIGMVYLLIKGKDKLAYFIVTGSFLYMFGALGLLFFSQRWLMIVGSSLEILIFAIGLTYKIQQEYKQKIIYQRESYINKTKALRAQINPHFIFNSLSSIQHLITSNNKESALKYLSKFSRLTRNILEGSIENTFLLADEIKMLKDYLELESLRFNDAFEYSINVDENIDTHAIEVPALIVQPFVENAILHGLLNKEGIGKKLTINYRIEDHFLICEVEDNGIGRQATSKKESIHKSRGVEVTEERLKNLNKLDINTQYIEIIDKYDGSGKPTGTKVIIKIYID
jgi:sensor histidine kinase YesM